MTRQASGLKAWVIQRITALYIGAFALYLLMQLLFSSDVTYQQWQAQLASPAMAITLWLFIIAILIHAWVGMRDIAIDYIKPIAIRVSVLTAFAFFLIACGLWASRVLILTSIV